MELREKRQIMKQPYIRILTCAGVLAAIWSCSESGANQDSVAKSSAENTDFKIPQNIVIIETSYFFQLGTKYYLIAPTNMTVSDGFGKIIGTFTPSTGTIMSLSGEIITINLDLSKLPIVTPRE